MLFPTRNWACSLTRSCSLLPAYLGLFPSKSLTAFSVWLVLLFWLPPDLRLVLLPFTPSPVIVRTGQRTWDYIYLMRFVSKYILAFIACYPDLEIEGIFQKQIHWCLIIVLLRWWSSFRDSNFVDVAWFLLKFNQRFRTTISEKLVCVLCGVISDPASASVGTWVWKRALSFQLRLIVVVQFGYLRPLLRNCLDFFFPLVCCACLVLSYENYLNIPPISFT